jgi:predicted lactoylglutathione lyase
LNEGVEEGDGLSTKIFVNLAVKDLERSKRFFTDLGYGFNAQFTGANGACLVISDDIYAMLLIEPFFKTFTSKELVDAHASTEVLIALSADSREEVDRMLTLALAAGGTEPRAAQDHGFMYSRAFDDPDGHTWEPFWMDPAAIAGGPPAA